MIHRHRGNRRKQDYAKAVRKQKIANAVYPGGYDACIGALVKGKIHCSCPICAAKTNSGLNKSKGPVQLHRGSRIPTTNKRFGKKHYKPSDIRKVLAADFQARESGSL